MIRAPAHTAARTTGDSSTLPCEGGVVNGGLGTTLEIADEYLRTAQDELFVLGCSVSVNHASRTTVTCGSAHRTSPDRIPNHASPRSRSGDPTRARDVPFWRGGRALHCGISCARSGASLIDTSAAVSGTTKRRCEAHPLAVELRRATVWSRSSPLRGQPLALGARVGLKQRSCWFSWSCWGRFGLLVLAGLLGVSRLSEGWHGRSAVRDGDVSVQ